MSETLTDESEETGTETGTEETETETPAEDSEGEADAEEDASGDVGDAEGWEDDDAEALSPIDGPTDEQIQKALDRIEKRGVTYTKAIGEIAGEVEQPLVRCPVCIPFVPGFIFDPSIVPLGEVQENGAKFLLGEAIGPDYRQAPNAATCPTCNGWGKVRTGSRVDAKGLLTCDECRGLGFIGEAANLTPAQVRGEEVIPLALAPDPDVSLPDEDQWGTPRSHPDFGKMPQYRAPTWADDLAVFKRTMTGEVS